MVSEAYYPYPLDDIEPVLSLNEGRAISAIAREMLALWTGYLTPGGACEWNLNVLCYAHDVNTVLETEDNMLIHAHVLVRYLQLGMPRSFVLGDPEKIELAEKLRAELRAIVGGTI